MAHRRDPRAVRRLDLAKYTVLLVLAVTAITLLTTRSCQPQLAMLKPTPAATLAPTFTAEAALARPVLVSPLTGATVRPGVIELRGEAARGYSIRVRDQAGRLLAATHVQPDASWTARAAIDAPGAVTLTLELVNAAGEVVATAEPLTLTVGMPAVAMRAPALDQTLVDATLTAGRLTLRGSGEPGATVEVIIDGAVAASTVVDGDGRWQVALQASAPGLYVVGLQSRDAAGAIVATATPVFLSLAAPPQPIVALPPTATATPDQTPPATVASIIVTTDPVNSRIAADGVGAEGVVIELLLDATVVATTTIGDTGAWALLAPVTQPAAYTISLRAIAPDGRNVFPLAPPPQGVVVTLPSPTPTATPAPTDEPIAPTATDTPTPTATDTPTAEPPRLDALPVAGAAGAGAALPLSGSGAPGDVVRVLVDGAPAGVTVVDAAGRWQLVVEMATAGAYSVTVESIDLSGAVRATAAPVVIDILPPTNTATATSTRTPTPVPTDTATATSTRTATPVPTNTATATSTQAATAVSAAALPPTGAATPVAINAEARAETTSAPPPTPTNTATATSTVATAPPADADAHALPPTGVDLNGAPVAAATAGGLLLVLLLVLADRQGAAQRSIQGKRRSS